MSSAAFGQTTLDKKIGADAIALGKLIEDENLVTAEDWAQKSLASDTISTSERLQLQRNIFMHSIWKSTPEEIQNNARTVLEDAKSQGTERDIGVANLFLAFADVFDTSYSAENFEQIKTALAPFYESKDWFVKHRAQYLSGQFEASSLNANIALQSAQEALALIPEDGSKYASEATILSVEDLANLHNLMYNPQLAVQTSAQLIDLQKQANVPIDGITLINNLVYSFSIWRDHKTTKALVDIILRLESQTQSGVPGLTELRASRVNNEIGNFQEALAFANRAYAAAEIAPVKESAQFSKIIAMAGLGQGDEAQVALDHLLNESSKSGFASKSANQKILHARALIAMAKGQNRESLRLMNQRMDQSIQYILGTNNNETAGMLAALQNSKERVDEREAALKRESELKQLALDRQRRVIVLLFAVAVILALLTFGTAAFARYRAKAAKEMELAAQKARAGEKAKSEFLAVMSHELRTPLNGILGMADILSRSAPTEALREKNNIILQSGNELLALVENIFDMTLLENDGVELDIDKADVHAMIDKVCSARRDSIQSRTVQFTTYVDPAVPQFMAIDAVRAGQCLDHLLSNASKFTLEGRVHVHITAQQASDGAPTELTLIVADTGVGISEEALARLFQPFVQADSSMTRQYGGAGLGLAITRSLARLMDGDLTVNSRENKGSEFTLTLSGMAIAPEISVPQDSRRAPQPMPEPSISTVASPIMQDSSERPNPLTDMVSVQGQRFLVVEDDIACQDVVKSLLEPTLSQVTCVGNGHEALQALSVNTYDFVIMDIRMPGMDGVTAARRIRKSGKAHANVPIIALTADVAAETNAKCRIAGVDMFLTKPVRAEEFYRAIELVSRKTKAIEHQKRIA